MKIYKKASFIVSVCSLAVVMCSLTFASVESGGSSNTSAPIFLVKQGERILFEKAQTIPFGSVDELKANHVNVDFSGSNRVEIKEITPELQRYMDLKGVKVSLPVESVKWCGASC